MITPGIFFDIEIVLNQCFSIQQAQFLYQNFYLVQINIKISFACKMQSKSNQKIVLIFLIIICFNSANTLTSNT